jgi:hypothetical protein
VYKHETCMSSLFKVHSEWMNWLKLLIHIVFVSGEGLLQNWMILLGHRRLQYIGEEPLGVAGG